LLELQIVHLFRQVIYGRGFGDYAFDYTCHAGEYKRARGGCQWAC
jgi:hypothetical protein